MSEDVRRNPWRIGIAPWLLALGMLPLLSAPQAACSEIPGTLLEDFASFPQQWKIKNDDPRAGEIYRVTSEDIGPYLAAVVGPKPGVRIFKYVSWDTLTFPVVTWKWRLRSFPPDKRRSVAFYVSIHRDSFGIPTIVKYLWSSQDPVGTVRPGGYFGATEIVIQSGASADPIEWATARVDAVSDFQQIYGQEPGSEGVGIGVLVGMGVEADIADVRVEPRAIN